MLEWSKMIPSGKFLLFLPRKNHEGRHGGQHQVPLGSLVSSTESAWKGSLSECHVWHKPFKGVQQP